MGSFVGENMSGKEEQVGQILREKTPFDNEPYMLMGYMQRESDDEHKKRLKAEMRKGNKNVNRNHLWRFMLHPCSEFDVIRIIHDELEGKTKVLPFVPWKYVESVRGRWGLNKDPKKNIAPVPEKYRVEVKKDG